MEHTVARFPDKDNTTPEEKLLAFVAALLVDLARTHPRVTDAQVALWLARVVVGA
jgi:hypothetical protein